MTQKLFFAPFFVLSALAFFAPQAHAGIAGFELGPTLDFYRYEEINVEKNKVLFDDEKTASDLPEAKDADTKTGMLYGLRGAIKFSTSNPLFSGIYVQYNFMTDDQKDDFFKKTVGVVADEKDEKKNKFGINGKLDSFHRFSAGIASEFVLSRKGSSCISVETGIGAGMSRYEIKQLSYHEAKIQSSSSTTDSGSSGTSGSGESSTSSNGRVITTEKQDVSHYFADLSARIKLAYSASPSVAAFVSGGARFTPVFKKKDDISFYSSVTKDYKSSESTLEAEDEVSIGGFALTVSGGVAFKTKTGDYALAR